MTVKSMTGYGKAERTTLNSKFTVEIRSLNSKQLDISMKTPQSYRILEMEIRKLVTASATRGKLDVVLTCESLSGNTSATFNDKAFKTYFNSISTAVRESGLNPDSQEFVAAILRLPEVLVPNNEELDPVETAAALDCCSEALLALDVFRLREGRALIDDIMNRITTIEHSLASIAPYEKARIEKLRLSIRNELNKIELVSAIDNNRFEQELVYYIEKIDITEEKVRLAQHCSFFRQTVDREAIPGRKLGFIAQEIGREINTIGAKANDVDIQKRVVEMKDELEKIKEQLLNIL
jgi:uncharacterized protein (TIGR00255 family)